jgi:tetratricopeptide (TPR) repeat protein
VSGTWGGSLDDNRVWLRGRTAIALLLGAALFGVVAVAAAPGLSSTPHPVPPHGGGGESPHRNLLAGHPCAGAEPALGSATQALDKGQWDDAEQLLRLLSASHADCSGVVLGLARVRAAQGDPVEAERLFARATTLAPDDALVHAQFAQYWLSRGRRTPADYLSSLALSLNPDCPEALVAQGQILSLKGEKHAAGQALQKAAGLDPANAEARYQLGIWFFRGMLYSEAVLQFEQVVARRPLDARAYDYLALSLQALGQAERAEHAYRGALKVNDGPFSDSFVDYNYGRFLLKQNRLEESRSYLDRAVVLHPDRRGPQYERGKLNLALKDYGAARKDAERALELRDPSGFVLDLQVYYLLATVYARLGESELARKYAELSRTTEIPDQAADKPR